MSTIVIIWGLVIILGAVVARRSRTGLHDALRFSLAQARMMALRLPLALLIGAFLIELVPRDVLIHMLGADSGLTGIVVASLVGGLLPGGPFISFPIAVAFYKAGVGAPQLIALVTAWSVYAVHRLLGYELPIMGARFTAIRLASSFLLPPLAGLAAALAVMVVPLSP